MQEMLQTKVKNMHQREILNLEKEFHSNLDKMRVQIHEDIEDAFQKELNRQKEDVIDKQE